MRKRLQLGEILRIDRPAPFTRLTSVSPRWMTAQETTEKTAKPIIARAARATAWSRVRFLGRAGAELSEMRIESKLPLLCSVAIVGR
jgi:hypothetical protein